MILSEKITGKIISVQIQSSNLKEAVYDTESKSLEVVFNNNKKYLYLDVPWEIFTRLRMSESQGKFFNTDVARKYIYREIKEQIEENNDTTGIN